MCIGMNAVNIIIFADKQSKTGRDQASLQSTYMYASVGASAFPVHKLPCRVITCCLSEGDDEHRTYIINHHALVDMYYM